jgi:hypothetical protein
MRPERPALAPLLLALLLGPAAASHAGVHAIALQGDPAPGVAGATFASFPTLSANTFSMPPLCDSMGHTVFFATTSTGVAGLWSDVSGSLAPVVLVGDALPGVSGPDTLQTIGNFLMSDRGQLAFYGIGKHGVTTYGLWYHDASGFTRIAENGESAPWSGGPATWDLSTLNFTAYNAFAAAGPMALNGPGRLALRTVTQPTPSSREGVWSFDPPPVVNRYLCEQAGFVPGIASLTALGMLSFNAGSDFAQVNTWYPGSGTANNGVWEGGCALLGSVLTNGDLAPAVGGIPATANITQIAANLPPDINAANAVAFTSWLVNGGVTSSNNTVVWLHDNGGFHKVCRMGDTAPELAAGETLTPNTFGAGGLSDQPQLVSDPGSVIFDATIQPSNAAAVMLYRSDGTLHVLGRDGGSAPGLPHRLFTMIFNQRGSTGLSMNHVGQILMQTATRDSIPGGPDRNIAFTTDASGVFTPIVVDQTTYTVRTGLTGTLLNFGLSSFPLPSNGTDGRWHNFSNTGQYVFLASFSPDGILQQPGVFEAGGPDISYLAVPPGAPTATRLARIAPNPTTGAAHVAFSLARSGAVRLEVLDLAGRRVKTLVAGDLDAGPHEIDWRGDDASGRAVARGIYFVRLRAPGADQSQRVAILR